MLHLEWDLLYTVMGYSCISISATSVGHFFKCKKQILTISWLFIPRSHRDYGDIIYDQPYNNSYHQNTISSLQRIISYYWHHRGNRQEQLYQELGPESLQHRCWHRKICCFCKLIKIQTLNYLSSIVPSP